MERQNIIVPFDYRQILSALSYEEIGRLLMGWLDYAKDGTVPQFTGNEKILWEMVKIKDDAAALAYKTKCEKNAENIKKRWSNTNVYERIQTNTNEYEAIPNIPNININSNTNNKKTNKKNNINTLASINISRKDDKPVRHKYGTYNNVLLSDEDMEKLKTEFPNDYEQRIENLSGYMESKGATYKNHLATIRNWARKEAKKNDDSTAENIHGYNQQLVSEWRKHSDIL